MSEIRVSCKSGSCKDLVYLRGGYRVAWHGDVEADALADGARINLVQFVCCSLCFGPAPVQAILKLIQ